MNITFTNTDIGLLLFFILVVLMAIFVYISYRDVLRK